MTSKPNLLCAIQSLDPFVRAHISTMRITTGPEGYRVVLSINHYGPVPVETKRHMEGKFPGITMLGVSRHPDIEYLVDWQTPIWEQILQLIKDPEISKPEELGSMEAAERSKDEADGTVSGREAMKDWIVLTHVEPKDRDAWVARCMKYSASIGSPAE